SRCSRIISAFCCASYRWRRTSTSRRSSSSVWATAGTLAAMHANSTNPADLRMMHLPCHVLELSESHGPQGAELLQGTVGEVKPEGQLPESHIQRSHVSHSIEITREICLLDHIASADLLKRSALAAGVHQNLQSASLLRHQHSACLIGKGAGAGPGYGTVVRFKLPTRPGNDDLEIIEAVVEVAGAAHALGNALDIPQARAPQYLPDARWRRGDFRVGLT